MHPHVVDHFSQRASRYDTSSAWCADDELVARIVGALGPEPDHQILDAACGTGLVARGLAGRVGRVVGLDITPAMAVQALERLDELVAGSAEAMPFSADSFDGAVCRQGIQFMGLPEAIEEMVRVVRPGGRIVLADLAAYGPEDADEYFEILRLRNPVRRHFFLPGDVGALLAGAGCERVEVDRYVSEEDVDVWADNGVIDVEAREAIRELYRTSTAGFGQHHSVVIDGDRIVDRMLFTLSVGTVAASTATW